MVNDSNSLHAGWQKATPLRKAEMNVQEAILALVDAELASGKATNRSLGVVYALAIGALGADPDNHEWIGPLNQKIHDAKGAPAFDAIKNIGWDLNDAIVRRAPLSAHGG